MDEHIVVNGDIEHLNEDIADINLNNLSWWIEKHNHYATREAIDMLLWSGLEVMVRAAMGIELV